MARVALLLVMVVCAMGARSARGAADPPSAERNHVLEVAFDSTVDYADPFNQVTLDAVFTAPDGTKRRVPGFWRGGRKWAARYSSPRTGRHSYRTECSDTANVGLHGVTGEIEVREYAGDNPLYAHGPLRVAPDKLHLEHEDGTPFFWLGDTWWMGLCKRLEWPADFQTLVADRVAKGFTVIQIVAGLYPDMPAFDERGANEAGFPWETDYSRIRPEYFDAADRRLEYLADQGLTPCIVGAWGYFIPWMGVDKLSQHWRYLIARYGAYPVVWCIAGEANLPWYLVEGFPYDDRQQVKQWTEVARTLRETDPFRRLISIHPTGLGRLSARGSIDDVSLIDFDMLQTGHGGPEVLQPTIDTLRWSLAEQPTMPVLDSEVAYEQLLGWIPADVQRLMFWGCMLSGAAGHTYGANGIWQVNRRDRPHGASPHGGNYGTLPWDDAMRLPGSAQLGLGKRLLERYPWQRFVPHPEWATWSEAGDVSLEGCRWIWFPEGKPAEDAPAERRYFRAVFELPAGQTVTSAALRASADDAFEAYVNGERVGESQSWRTARQFAGLAHLLRPGRNAIAIEAANAPASVPRNPAGLVACLEVRLGDGSVVHVRTGSDWRCAKEVPGDWKDAGFDDARLASAMNLGAYGMEPWGRLEGHGPYDVPYAAGIEGSVRVIYVPERGAITVHGLGKGTAYTGFVFDPVTGAETPLGPMKPDAAGDWVCQPPALEGPDWVVVLESRGGGGGGGGRELTLNNDQVAWRVEWPDGRPRATALTNHLTGSAFPLAGGRELTVMLSASPDGLREPVRDVDDFTVQDSVQRAPDRAEIHVRSPSTGIEATIHYALEGPTRRKWATVRNASQERVLLLDVRLDDFGTGASTSGGGPGWPLFLADEVFAAVEYPSGENVCQEGRVTLTHFPGRVLQPGAEYESHTALVSVAEGGRAADSFVSYLDARCVRKKRVTSVYTPFGINNQWGPCPTLDDEETLDVLRVLDGWREKGVRFDYFTLDTGWADPGADLTEFRPWAYPEGPRAVIDRVHDLGMDFGLWFATSWAAESCWGYAPAWDRLGQPTMRYKNGAPDKAGFPGSFCYGTEAYSKLVREAVLHHIRESHARFIKVDGGSYRCDNTDHGHLPGRYSTERMYDSLVELARAARAEAPDVFVMWYWGLGSPFWVLYGDTIFESGLFMEGSGTSSFPTLYYRDSVTLAQDENAQHARLIPPLCKDSLGVWLADTRWGNYMGKERWREALVMDLGRGSLLFPNLWGDAYLLDDSDVEFLAWISQLAKRNESVFLHRRTIAGDPARNEPYGYAYSAGGHGFVFLNNAHFAARRVTLELGPPLGLDAPAGTPLSIVSLFPERARVLMPGHADPKVGDRLDLWLRPFEVLMLEVDSAAAGHSDLPVRPSSSSEARRVGVPLALEEAAEPSAPIEFTDAERFRAAGLTQSTHSYSVRLPDLAGEQSILAIPIRLRQGAEEWRHSPCVAEIVQAVAYVDDRQVQLMPVPDARQFGNTQHAGCSWVVYQVRLSREWSGRELRIDVSAWLPPEVEARTEAWLLRRWWQRSARPSPEGYFTDAPS